MRFLPCLYAFLGCVSFCFQHGVVFKHAVRGNAAFGSQFVCSSVFVTASDQRKTQREKSENVKKINDFLFIVSSFLKCVYCVGKIVGRDGFIK